MNENDIEAPLLMSGVDIKDEDNDNNWKPKKGKDYKLA